MERLTGCNGAMGLRDVTVAMARAGEIALLSDMRRFNGAIQWGAIQWKEREIG